MGERCGAAVLLRLMEGLLLALDPPPAEQQALAQGFGAALLQQGGVQAFRRRALAPWAQRLLSGVSAEALQAGVLGLALDGQLAAAAGPALPLVTGRLAWLVRALRNRVLAARAATEAEGGQGVEHRWSGIVFCDRRVRVSSAAITLSLARRSMAAGLRCTHYMYAPRAAALQATCEAVHRLLAALPCLRDLLRPGVFIGAGSDTHSAGGNRSRLQGHKVKDKT